MTTGSEWVKLQHHKPSEFGCRVADLLGELMYGIYHLDYGALNRVNWANETYIQLIDGYNHWGTFDSNYLTRLVLLAHKYGIKVSIASASPNYLRITFWKINKHYLRSEHPTIEEAVASVFGS
jgi:hypothetical protein